METDGSRPFLEDAFDDFRRFRQISGSPLFCDQSTQANCLPGLLVQIMGSCHLDLRMSQQSACNVDAMVVCKLGAKLLAKFMQWLLCL
jgi:hypothetical protein